MAFFSRDGVGGGAGNSEKEGGGWVVRGIHSRAYYLGWGLGGSFGREGGL